MISRNSMTPKNGAAFKVLIIARISTKNQDLRSLDEQISLCKKHALTMLSSDNIEFQTISSQSSGEILDRKELLDAEAAVDRGDLDMVIVEDLARFSRRNRALDFCEQCQDKSTRFIAINDHIDTTSDNWHLGGLIASFQHEQHNLKLAQRLKTRLRERFITGGALACPIYGYRKRPGATSDADLEKIPEAQSTVTLIFKMLEDGASYSEVADYLNESGIEPGAYCRGKKWNCAMVSRFVFNPILKGIRVRNRKESRRINKTGRHRSFNAPQSMHLYRECPHLAFIDAETYDRVIALLKARNAIFARGVSKKAPDCRVGIPKKSTIWPGQHLKCGICNRIYIWGGHGVTAHMMCAGCRDYKCWNSTSVDGFDTSRLLTEAILQKIEKLPNFDSVFLEKIRDAITRRRATRTQELDSLDSDIRNIEVRIERITEAIAAGAKNDALFSKLSSLESELQFKKRRREEVLREPTDQFEMPNIDQVRSLARTAIESLARDSAEFGRIMTRLIPSLTRPRPQPQEGLNKKGVLLSDGSYHTATGAKRHEPLLRTIHEEHCIDAMLF